MIFLVAAAFTLVACGGEPEAVAPEASPAETAAAIEDAARSDVDCRVETADGSYEGRCGYLPEGRNESFSIEPVGGDVFTGDITSISVTVTRPGQANVRGLTTSGINSNWGNAEPFADDLYCWVGADFSVCTEA